MNLYVLYIISTLLILALPFVPISTNNIEKYLYVLLAQHGKQNIAPISPDILSK